MERWAGKNAVVTGAASGIGEAITAALLRNKGNVVALDIRYEELLLAARKWEQIEHHGNIRCMYCDVSEPDNLEEVFSIVESEWNGVDIMVNNAGVVDYTRVIGKI